MQHIRSRRHSAVNARHSQLLMSALSLATGLVVTAPAVTAATGDDADAGTRASAKELPMVKVEASRGKDYKVNFSDSPKFSQSLLDTPQTMSIISKEVFAQQGDTTLTEVLRNSPGVGTFYVGENGSTSTGDAIYMRGFDSSGSIFVDGVRDLGSISRDVFNIEQVEVVKGPASADNGRTAPTGAINMISKQAHLGQQVSAILSYGSGEHKRATADWNQPLGGHTAMRLNVMKQDSGVPGRDRIKHDRWGVAPTLAFGLGTATRIYLDYLHVSQNNVPDGGIPTIGLPGYSSPDPDRPELGQAPRVDTSNFYGTSSDYDDVDADMLTLRVLHEFGKHGVLYNTTRWGSNKQDYLLTSYKMSTDYLHTPDINDPSSWTIDRHIPTFKLQKNRILANQTQYSVSFDGAHVQQDLNAGVELSREQLDITGMGVLNDTSWPAASLYHPDADVQGLLWGRNGADGKGRTDTVAAYLFDTLKFGSHWQINAGVRVDHYRTHFSKQSLCGRHHGPDCGDLPKGTALPYIDASVGGNLFNWKMGILYKPAANASLYANFAVAAEPPGGAHLELSGRPNKQDNPNFNPQKARTSEIGGKWELGDGRLLLTAALYRTIVSNEVVKDPVDQQYYQTGRKRVQGIELGAVGHITERWAISAGYSALDAKVVSGKVAAEDGSRDLAYTPGSAFTAWNTWLWRSGLTLGIGARYTGQLKRGTDHAVGTPEYTRAWWVADAMLSYPLNKHVDLQMNINNLFDQDYVSAINKSGYRYTPGRPRSAMLTARIRF